MDKRTALLLCTHNSSGSQLTEGLLRSIHGEQWIKTDAIFIYLFVNERMAGTVSLDEKV